ncbi:MAG: hypothetical protein ACRC6B_07070, partial [Fusobacteriaceae bacterium]
APNPSLRVASLRPKGMVPSDRLGEFPDWKTVEIKRRPDGRPFLFINYQKADTLSKVLIYENVILHVDVALCLIYLNIER